MSTRIDPFPGADRPWAVLPDTLRDVMAARATFAQAGASARQQFTGALEGEPDGYSTVETSGRVAVLPLSGLITPGGGGLMAALFGGTGLNDFARALDAAVTSADVDAIVLDVDSPGGSVELLPETAAMVRQAAAAKPMVAAVNTLCASAAYWLASQAHQIVATPSGAAGSIGVYTAHTEFSAMDERDGIKTTLISAGKYKVEGNPYEPLSDEALAAIQAEIDDLYGMFVADVAKGRNTSASAVQAGYGQGRLLGAARAVDAGLVDRVGTLTDAIALAASGDVRTTQLPAAPAASSSSPRGGDVPEVDQETRSRLASVLV